MSHLRHRKTVYMTGTLPGKLVIVKPIKVILFSHTDYVDAINPDTFFYSAQPTKGEALAGLKREIVLMMKHLKEEERDNALPRHIHASEMNQLAYLRAHIVPQGSPRSKKRG